jgi:hypothetical protein
VTLGNSPRAARAKVSRGSIFNRWPTALAAMVLALSSTPLMAQSAYKYRDANGQWVFTAGAHAIVLTGSIPALRERDARLGGTRKDEDSFLLTDAGHSARRRMFRAPLTSRSCDTPHAVHVQRLTCNPLTPRGPVRESQCEQVQLVFLSLTI